MFDINSPNALFFYINSAMDRYQSSRDKSISDVFFLIMALNHLREWIAPDYNPKFNKQTKCQEWKEATCEAELFSHKIYNQEQFSVLRNICNGTKHLSKSSPATTASYDLAIDDWSSIDNVFSFDRGAPSGFFVEGTPLEDILISVINYYKNNWFAETANLR